MKVLVLSRMWDGESDHGHETVERISVHAEDTLNYVKKYSFIGSIIPEVKLSYDLYNEDDKAIIAKNFEDAEKYLNNYLIDDSLGQWFLRIVTPRKTVFYRIQSRNIH